MSPVRHRIGTGKACWCGCIHYTNPAKRPDGRFKCAVCFGIHPDWQTASDCAVADHKARIKKLAAKAVPTKEGAPF